MTREGKTVTLASLTVLLYGLSSFIQLKQVIFPFPLNEIIFLIVSVIFVKYHFNTYPKTVLLILGVGLMNVLSYEFYWNIFLSNEQMLKFSKSSASDVFKLVYYIGLIAWINVSFVLFEENLKKYFALIPITLLLVGTILSDQLSNFYSHFIIFLSIASVFALLFSKIKQYPLLYLWVLLFVLEATKVWSLASLQ